MKKDDRGVSLVTVIVSIAFVGILVSVIMYTSLLNFKMKQVNLKARDNFYTAEQALNEVTSGLQEVVSRSLSSAYLDVLENYAIYGTSEKNDLMESQYFTNLWTALEETGSSHTKYRLDLLNGYLKETKWVADPTSPGGGYGAIISSDDKDDATSPDNEMATFAKNGVVLKNVKVYYRDQKGLVSIIRTDIKLVYPELEFGASTALPDLTAYSTIADEKFITGTVGVNEIKGSFYAGDMEINNEVQVSGGEYFISKKDIRLTDAKLSVLAANTVWAGNIVADSSELSLLGKTNVADDLTIGGRSSKITIGGSYNGYGNSLEDASESSAIVVNGADAALDLSQAQMLTLAGHAFVSTKKHNAGAVDGSITEQGYGKNVLTGESLAIKSNQLMYLLPGECIGVSYTIDETGHQNFGEAKFGRNPLTATQYQEIMQHPEWYKEIRDNAVVGKLGNPLAAYIKNVAGEPQAEKVFVQTNAGESLVYYYMTFKDENAANQYFKDYYGINEAALTDYMKFYTSGGIQMSDPQDMIRLELAGNAIKWDDTVIQTILQENTVDDASSQLALNQLAYSKNFDALCTKLVTNYAQLSDLYTNDLSKDIVFDNIVNVEDIPVFLNNYGLQLPGGTANDRYYRFQDVDLKVSALVIDNPDTEYVFTGDSPADQIPLLIATGDVRLTGDFHGLLLCDKTLTVEPNVRLTANEELAKSALNLTSEKDGNIYNVIGFFWDGKEYLKEKKPDASEVPEEFVKLKDLVIYENWSKE